MPRLPRFATAVVSHSKLRDYLLSDVHPVGHSKEFFFRMLGYTRNDSDRLQRDLMDWIARSDAKAVGSNEYGTKYMVSGRLHCPSGLSPPILTVWIVLRGESDPRFVTAYPETWP